MAVVADAGPWEGPPLALFWDQSLVWGMICIETLERLGIPFHLLTGGDIVQDRLEQYRVLVVPGGWASHKLRSLGDWGKDAITRFVRNGGSYIGFCGGAGLALSSPASLGLVPLERMPLSERLPSASGEVGIRSASSHPAWNGLPEALCAPIWWPSQFLWRSLPDVSCVATYVSTGPDFCVSDLPTADIERSLIPWEIWENIYGINLSPERLLGQPAIIEARLCRGTLVLSYPHIETPGSIQGNRLFRNILDYLDAEASRHRPVECKPEAPPLSIPSLPSMDAVECLNRIRSCVEELIVFGERHLLWRWRLPWLLQWRRGIRGLEYGTLAVIARYLANESESAFVPEVHHSPDPWTPVLERIEKEAAELCSLAERLLIEEKLATQTGHLSKLGSVNDSVDKLRTQLFGSRMNHGGLCQSLFDKLDWILLQFLRRRAITSVDGHVSVV